MPTGRSFWSSRGKCCASYDTPGLFFDIVLTPDCVCPRCLQTMSEQGLDPQKAEDRLRNDEWVNERFRTEMSAALRAEFPGTRIFYNCGHIHKQGPKRFEHLHAP